MNAISDFTDTERQTVQSAIAERWADEPIGLHLADVELKLWPEDRGPSTCPALFWSHGECNFVITKTGDSRYRCQFFYNNELEQMGTGVDEFDNIGDCAVALLRTQADDESVRTGAFPEGRR